LISNDINQLELRVDDDNWKQIDDLAHIVTGAFKAGLESSGVSIADVGATIVLADDLTVKQLNQQWRNQENATNILSFPAPKDEKTETGQRYLGDMILALGVVSGEADEQGKALATHLCHLVIHGALHLLGYDHMKDDEARQMEDLERTAMTALKLPDPYLPNVAIKEMIKL